MLDPERLVLVLLLLVLHSSSTWPACRGMLAMRAL